MLLCVGEGQDCLGELAFSPADWLVLRVTLRGSPGLGEQVGGVLGMLWRIWILRDVLFFCKLLRKWCVCMYMCVVWKYGDVYLVRCSHCFGGSIVKGLKFQDLAPKFSPSSAICV